MELNEYLKGAISTAIFPLRIPDGADREFAGLLYCACKLNGEAGEVAEHIGKALRDDKGHITSERKLKLISELGDVLWYLAALADLLGVEFDYVARMNLEKLESRKQRGVLGGSGSDR